MELVSAIIQPSNLIIKVVLLMDLSGGISEHLRVHLGVWETHVMGQMRLHFWFTHTSHGEYLGVFRFSTGEHCLGISSGVDDAGLMESASIFVVSVGVVEHLLGFAT